jgi:hypothetical protein
MRWLVHVLQSNLIKNNYNIILPSTSCSSKESPSFRVPHYNTPMPCTRYLEDKKLTRYHVFALHQSTHRLNTQLPPRFVAEKHVVKQGSSCKLYSFISKQSFTTEPRAKAQFIKWKFRRGKKSKQRERSVEFPPTPRVMFPISECSTFLRQLSTILSMIINR